MEMAMSKNFQSWNVIQTIQTHFVNTQTFNLIVNKRTIFCNKMISKYGREGYNFVVGLEGQRMLKVFEFPDSFEQPKLS